MKKNEIEVLEKEIKKKKKFPQEIQAKINKTMFINFFTAILIMVYFISIILTNIYLNKNIFILICRILNFTSLVATIVLFEIAYYKEKRKNSNIWNRMDGYIPIYNIYTIHPL